MSGIYIPKAKIPDGDYVRVLMLYKDGTCIDGIGNIFKVISVPDHGRLIEETSAFEHVAEYVGGYVSLYLIKQGLQVTPTIIPTDQEGKG